MADEVDFTVQAGRKFHEHREVFVPGTFLTLPQSIFAPKNYFLDWGEMPRRIIVTISTITAP
jgi:hypothetical protein